MRTLVRHAMRTPAGVSIWLIAALASLTACTGTSVGQPSGDTAKGYGDRAIDYASDPGNGKLIGAVFVIIAVGSFLGWILKNWAVRVLLAMAAGITIAYLMTRGQ